MTMSMKKTTNTSGMMIVKQQRQQRNQRHPLMMQFQRLLILLILTLLLQLCMVQATITITETGQHYPSRQFTRHDDPRMNSKILWRKYDYLARIQVLPTHIQLCDTTTTTTTPDNHFQDDVTNDMIVSSTTKTSTSFHTANNTAFNRRERMEIDDISFPFPKKNSFFVYESFNVTIPPDSMPVALIIADGQQQQRCTNRQKIEYVMNHVYPTGIVRFLLIDTGVLNTPFVIPSSTSSSSSSSSSRVTATTNAYKPSSPVLRGTDMATATTTTIVDRNSVGEDNDDGDLDVPFYLLHISYKTQYQLTNYVSHQTFQSEQEGGPRITIDSKYGYGNFMDFDDFTITTYIWITIIILFMACCCFFLLYMYHYNQQIRYEEERRRARRTAARRRRQQQQNEPGPARLTPEQIHSMIPLFKYNGKTLVPIPTSTLTLFDITNRTNNQDQDDNDPDDDNDEVEPLEAGNRSSREPDGTLVTEAVSSSTTEQDRHCCSTPHGGTSSCTTPLVEWMECSICLDEYHRGTKIRVLPCTHSFHSGCIERWLMERSATCPLCKYEVITQEDYNTAYHARIQQEQQESSLSDPSITATANSNTESTTETNSHSLLSYVWNRGWSTATTRGTTTTTTGNMESVLDQPSTTETNATTPLLFTSTTQAGTGPSPIEIESIPEPSTISNRSSHQRNNIRDGIVSSSTTTPTTINNRPTTSSVLASTWNQFVAGAMSNINHGSLLRRHRQQQQQRRSRGEDYNMLQLQEQQQPLQQPQQLDNTIISAAATTTGLAVDSFMNSTLHMETSSMLSEPLISNDHNND